MAIELEPKPKQLAFIRMLRAHGARNDRRTLYAPLLAAGLPFEDLVAAMQARADHEPRLHALPRRGRRRHAVASVARSRAQLSVGFVEGNCIRCFYHGWSSIRRVTSSSARPKNPRDANLNIDGYPTEEYLA